MRLIHSLAISLSLGDNSDRVRDCPRQRPHSSRAYASNRAEANIQDLVETAQTVEFAVRAAFL